MSEQPHYEMPGTEAAEADPGVKRAHEWGALAIATLEGAGLLRRHKETGQLYPTDEAGVVEGVFVPLCEPQLARLVTSLLDQYLTRAAAAQHGTTQH